MDFLDSSSTLGSFKNHEDMIEPGELLEETWFFGNLLDGKPRMLRCYSDPCPSSSKTSSDIDDDDMFPPGKSMEETFSSINKIPEGNNKRLLSLRVPGTGLMKAPSLPPRVMTAKQEPDSAQGNDLRIQETSRVNSLLRAPSLPSFAEKDEIQDDESEFSMGNLIRQASLNQSKPLIKQGSLNQSKPLIRQGLSQSNVLIRQGSLNQSNSLIRQGSLSQSNALIRQGSLNQSKVLPPRQTAKGVTRSCSISTIPKQNPRKKSEPESNNNPNLDSNSGEIKPRYATNQSKLRKSHSSIDTEEVKGLKNLGLNLKDEEKASRNAHPSEAWLAKSFGPQLQSRPATSKKSAEEDMKAQIKFWARAVASNVRQEC